MLKVTKLIRVYADGHKQIDSTPYISCGSKKQLEALRQTLIKNFNCSDIRFVYEER